MLIKLDYVTNWSDDITKCRTSPVIININNISYILSNRKLFLNEEKTLTALYIGGTVFNLLIEYNNFIEKIEQLKTKVPKNIKVDQGGNL